MSVLADGYRRLAEELNIPICLTQVLIDHHNYDENDNEENVVNKWTGLVDWFHFDFEIEFSD